MAQDRIEREIVVEAPIERVWALLTEAEHLGSWFGDAGAEVDLRPGGTLALRWAEHGEARGVIEAVEPLRFFAYRWAPFRDPGGAEPTAGNSTLVEFSLTREDGGTRVRVVESGFATLDCTPEQQARNVEGNTEGWEIELGHLAAELARATAGAGGRR